MAPSDLEPLRAVWPEETEARVRELTLHHEDYRIEVTIEDQVDTTTVIEVLRNDGEWMAETEFLHPLPPGAAVTGLTLWIDGAPFE